MRGGDIFASPRISSVWNTEVPKCLCGNNPRKRSACCKQRKTEDVLIGRLKNQLLFREVQTLGPPSPKCNKWTGVRKSESDITVLPCLALYCVQAVKPLALNNKRPSAFGSTIPASRLRWDHHGTSSQTRPLSCPNSGHASGTGLNSRP